MKTFSQMQSIAIFFHIPLWIAAGCVIVLLGAYNAGLKEEQMSESYQLGEINSLMGQPLSVLTQYRVFQSPRKVDL